MKVPKGKTFYFGKKVLKAGDEIPALLESKFSKILNKENKGVDPLLDKDNKLKKKTFQGGDIESLDRHLNVDFDK